MNDRYERLFSLPKNLYTSKAPVIILAGALLKDHQTGNVLAQLKFNNLSLKMIEALSVQIKCFNIIGEELQGTEYQYLDLSAARHSEFGQRTAIQLPDNTTRSISVVCTNVVFSDHTFWNAEESAVWDSLPNQQNLGNIIGNLAEQYCRETSSHSRFVPLEYSDLWICSCGTVNKQGDSYCCRCGIKKQRIFSALNVELLTQNREQFQAEQAQQKEIQEKEQKERHVKIKKIVVRFFVVTTVAVMLIVLGTQVLIPMQKYNSAISSMETGQYEDAILTFEKLGDYKDSAQLLTEARYRNANHLFESEKYGDSLSIYESLDNYADSNNKILECYFNLGEQYFQEGDYATALEYYKNAQEEPLESRTTEKIYENAIKLYQEDSYDFAHSYFDEVRNYEDTSLYCGLLDILDSGDSLTDIVEALSEDPYADFSPAKTILEDNPYHQIVILNDYQGIYRKAGDYNYELDSSFYIKISGYDISILECLVTSTVSSEEWENEEETQSSEIIDVNNEGIYTVRSKEWYSGWALGYEESEYTWQFSFKDGGIKVTAKSQYDYEPTLTFMSVEAGQYEKIS